MVHLLCSMYQYLVLFYHQKYSILWIYYIVFIHLPVGGFSGYSSDFFCVDWTVDIVSRYGAAFSWEFGRGSLVLHAAFSTLYLTLREPSLSMNRIAWTSLSMETEVQERECHFLRARQHPHGFCHILLVTEVTRSDSERGKIGYIFWWEGWYVCNWWVRNVGYIFEFCLPHPHLSVILKLGGAIWHCGQWAVGKNDIFHFQAKAKKNLQDTPGELSLLQLRRPHGVITVTCSIILQSPDLQLTLH